MSKEVLTTIASVRFSEDHKARVVLRENPFHPSGGGQPGDTGLLRGEQLRALVVQTTLDKQTQEIFLELKLEKGKPEAGMEVIVAIDEGRNHILSRMHTGQHIFSRLQEDGHEGLKTRKVALNVDESVIYVDYDGQLEWDDLFDVEEHVLEVIRANRDVEFFYASRAEAEKFPELKIHWDRVDDAWIRIVRIAGLDATACSGTHVEKTADIGDFMITSFKGSAPEWEVRFVVDADQRRREYGRATRRLLRRVGCTAEQAEQVFMGQKQELAALRHVLDKAGPYIRIPWEERRIAGRQLFFASLSDLSRELLSLPTRHCVEEHPEAFCLVLLPGAVGHPFPFVLLRGARQDTDLSGFVKQFPELQIRGGGKPNGISGTTTQPSAAVWLDCFSRYLSV